MQQPRTYYKSSGMHTSSSVCASVNYFDRKSGTELDALHRQMRDELGDFIVVDGSDDWYSNKWDRPESFFVAFNRSRLNVESGPQVNTDLLAYYHSGTSGITKSGIVVSVETFDALAEWYEKEFGHPMNQNPRLKIHFGYEL
jgi:hypothetical protein